MTRGCSPKGRSQTPNLFVSGLFFRVFSCPAHPYPPRSLPILFPYLSFSHFSPPLPFSKEVNKKLSYREQNALSVIKIHEANINCIYPYASLDWPGA